MAYFEVLSHHFPGGTEENLDKCESSRASSGLILSPKSRKHYPLYRKIRNVLINFNLNLSEFSQWRKYRPCVYVKWKKSNLLRRLLTPILISGTLRAFYISQMEWLEGETTRPVWLAAGREAQEINNSLSALFVSTTMESSGSNNLSCCQH